MPCVLARVFFYLLELLHEVFPTASGTKDPIQFVLGLSTKRPELQNNDTHIHTRTQERRLTETRKRNQPKTAVQQYVETTVFIYGVGIELIRMQTY